MKSLLKKICLCSMGIFLGTQITISASASADTTTAVTTDTTTAVTTAVNAPDPVITSLKVAPTGNSYYVATDGDDNNPGTKKKPFATLMKAQQAANAGDTVFIRGGFYNMLTVANTANVGKTPYHYVLEFDKSGITYRGYNTEIPVFDFSNIPTDARVAGFHITPAASDVTFQQFEVTGIKVGSNQRQAEGFRIEGKNVNLNLVNVHDTQAVGIYYIGHSTGKVYRCDSYNNIGLPGTNYENTSIGNCDGFGAHGDGTIFKECRAWNNSDDGYDCINVHGPVVFDSCWAFDMNAGGDSNGFKVGGFARAAQTVVPSVHTVTNCIAADNGQHGFYANHQPSQAATWINNTSYNNKTGNFNMLECATLIDGTDIPGTREVLNHNLAYKNNTLDQANLPAENNTNNSWNLDGVTMTDADFQSLDMNQLSKPRSIDGTLPSITFMKPTDSEKFAGLGNIYK